MDFGLEVGGSEPNDSGVYGFGKVRGVFDTPLEADERAEFLIRNAIHTTKFFTHILDAHFLLLQVLNIQPKHLNLIFA